jgi:GNAT superfamily N-acetyltransferase
MEVKIMCNIKIRQATATEADFNGITGVYKPDDEAPWSKPDECRAWISKRLERGFYIQLAEIDGKIVAHGEWVISDEPNRKFLYLGMMEVNEAYQRKGIGRAMIADGLEYARKNNCTQAVTMPGMETCADIFYRKYGFKERRKHYSAQIETAGYKDYEFEKISLDKVPFDAIKEKKFIFGKAQFSSRHIWEVHNEKPSTDDRLTPAILLPDGTYIQIGYWEGSDGGFTMIWTNSTNYSDIIKSALSFGCSLGLHHLDFHYLEDEENFLDGFELLDKKYEEDFEQIYYIKELGE